MSKRHKKEKWLKVVFLFSAILVVLTPTYFFVKRKISDNVEKNKPLVVETTVPEKQELDLLGKASVSFVGGTKERNKNIELGISHLNGVTVLPGEEFSFIKMLGPVTKETGYSEAKVFLNGEVTKGIGGGLCQVSTTLFRSLLSAGLDITERHNHSYTVSYYDVGLDATYSDPGPDLKFVNDTSHPVTIKGYTENQKAVFEIYGVKDGRVASTTEAEVTAVVDFPDTRYVATTTLAKGEPECVNKPQIGYTAKVTYGVMYPDNKYKEHVFTSVYKPLQRVCYVVGDKPITLGSR